MLVVASIPGMWWLILFVMESVLFCVYCCRLQKRTFLGLERWKRWSRRRPEIHSQREVRLLAIRDSNQISLKVFSVWMYFRIHSWGWLPGRLGGLCISAQKLSSIQTLGGVGASKASDNTNLALKNAPSDSGEIRIKYMVYWGYCLVYWWKRSCFKWNLHVIIIYFGKNRFYFFVAQAFYRLTDLARSMAKYPVAPAFAKMLCIGNQHNLLPYVVIIVAALSVQEVFIEAFLPADNNEEVRAGRRYDQVCVIERFNCWFECHFLCSLCRLEEISIELIL